jgi:hypothetical protein
MLRNWKDERDSAALFDSLARIERNPRLSEVFVGAAAAAVTYAVGRLVGAAVG